MYITLFSWFLNDGFFENFQLDVKMDKKNQLDERVSDKHPDSIFIILSDELSNKVLMNTLNYIHHQFFNHFGSYHF